MSKNKRLSKGIRKYIRTQKARIRRDVLDTEEQRKQIEKLYDQFNLIKKK